MHSTYSDFIYHLESIATIGCDYVNCKLLIVRPIILSFSIKQLISHSPIHSPHLVHSLQVCVVFFCVFMWKNRLCDSQPANWLCNYRISVCVCVHLLLLSQHIALAANDLIYWNGDSHQMHLRIVSWAAIPQHTHTYSLRLIAIRRIDKKKKRKIPFVEIPAICKRRLVFLDTFAFPSI